ncbi:MAG: glycoside hydrolase family 5 protein [Myxococcota bacterium]|jgi:endoglycosylceramidase|nr:glycoside hydrolase family 5 protein [Myxococcota bacterium]
MSRFFAVRSSARFVHHASRSTLLGLLAVGLACGDDDAPRDGGFDAAVDASIDAPADSGADAEMTMAICDRAAGDFGPLSTRCQHFVDADGRVVILRGVNARIDGVFDVDLGPGRVPLQPIPSFDASDATAMRAFGFNVLRLPMQWSGVEPNDTTPPTYVDDYLDRVEAVLDACRDAGIFVLVDLHQDAYSKWIGEDGAPLWAIVPEPDMILEGPLTDLAERRTSGQVLRAFETFFGDSAVGERLRARYAAMAAHVATRFSDHPAVIGYDVFNEPVADDDQTRRLNVSVAEAIRAVTRQLVFFEPPALQRNLADASGTPGAPFPVEGAVYAPHVYTLAFIGTDEQRESFTIATLRRGNRTAADEARRWGTPLFIGEFGYDPAGIRAADYYRMQLDLQDEVGASSAVWLWKEDSQGSWGFHDFEGEGEDGTWVQREAMVALFDRGFPERIAGWPRGWSWATEAAGSADDRLVVTYDGDDAITAPTVLRLPEGEWAITCDGAAASVMLRDGRHEVACVGGGTHVVEAVRE